jgi:hypothetical protein
MPAFDRSGRRVFICGWHRTGTTSLHVALQQLGFRVHGYDERLMRRLMAGREHELWLAARRSDAFRDFPWSLLYRDADARFRDARFILTTRSTSSWLESYKRHHDTFGPTPIHTWLYGVDSPHGNEDVFVRRYEAHNRDVAATFAGRPERLLTVDVLSGMGWEELCRFLDRPVPAVPFPHEKSGVLPLPDEPERPRKTSG